MKLFGTTGIRKEFCTYDKEEKYFSPSIALRLGLAIGTFIKSGTVVVGRDIRTTAIPIELALTSGLVSTGCHVLSIGMVTTPTLAMSAERLNADAGIMITASHNPPEYIGLKLWNRNGLGFTPEQEQKIEELYYARNFLHKPWNEIGSVTNIQDINTMHIEEVLKRVIIQPNFRHFSIILDPGNGSSCYIAPMLLNKLGFKYITLNSQPDGTFPGRLSEPSSKNLQDLRDFVSFSKNCELGIALDGDADRVIFINGNGKEIEAVRILTFLAREYLKEHPEIPKEKRKVVTPINSSGVIEYVLKPLGVEVIRCQVGDIKVSMEMERSGAFLGGESSGTYIWPFFHMGPDSLMTITLLLKYVSQYEKNFQELIEEIPEFPFYQEEFELTPDRIFEKKDYEEIRDKVVSEFQNAGFHNIETNMLDGLRINFDEGWVLIRKSGTTPIMRINAESIKNMDATKTICELAEKAIREKISMKKKN